MLAPGILNSSIGPRPTLSWRATSALDALYPSLWGGLLGLWAPALGQASGLLDLVGRDGFATITNATWTTSPIGPALFFGTNADVTTGSVRTIGSSDFAYVARVYFTNTYSFQPFISRSSGVTNSTVTMDIVQANNRLRIDLGDGSAYTTTNSTAGVTPLNKWHDIVVQRRSGTVEFYVNGAAAGTGANTRVVQQGTAMEFGNVASGDYDWLDGSMAITAEYNRTLTPWEIRLLARDTLAQLRRREAFGVFPAPGGGSTPWLYARQHGRIFGGGIC